MEKVHIDATVRKEKGKGAARRLRRKGFVPAVLYGAKRESLSLALTYSDVHRVVERIERENILLELKVKDDKEEEKVEAVVKEVQRDPVNWRVVHLDLYEIVRGQKVRVYVPVHLIGKPVGVEMGGIIEHELRELEVECLPRDLPSSIDVDVSSLGIGDSLHVRDIKLKEGIRILEDPEATVVAIVAPVKEEVASGAGEEEGIPGEGSGI